MERYDIMKRLLGLLFVFLMITSVTAYAWVDVEKREEQIQIQTDLRYIDTYSNYIFTADKTAVYIYSKDDINNKLNTLESDNIIGLNVYKDYLIVPFGDGIKCYNIPEIIGGSTEAQYTYDIKVENFGVSGDYMISKSTSNVFVYNISNIDEKINYTGIISDFNPEKIWVRDGYILANYDDSGIFVYELDKTIKEKSIANSLVSILPMPVFDDTVITMIADIEIEKNIVYISTNKTEELYRNAVFAYDLNEGKQIGKYVKRVDALGTRMTDLFAVNNVLFVSSQAGQSVQMVDISNPENMQTLVSIEIGDTPHGYSFTYEDNVLYVCNRTSGIDVFEVMPSYITEIKIYNETDNIGIIEEGEQCYAAVSIENYENRDVDGKLILAKYKDSKLTDITVKDVKAEKGCGKMSFNTEKVTCEAGEEIKAMFLDDFFGMVPYKDAVNVEDKEVEVIYDIYVDAVNGNDINDGSKESPFKTISKAKESVRKYNRYAKGYITVWINGDEYFTDTAIDFNEEDGGYNGYKIIYKAVDSNKPVISGGIRVSGWELYDEDKNIYRAAA